MILLFFSCVVQIGVKIKRFWIDHDIITTMNSPVMRMVSGTLVRVHTCGRRFVGGRRGTGMETAKEMIVVMVAALAVTVLAMVAVVAMPFLHYR